MNTDLKNKYIRTTVLICVNPCLMFSVNSCSFVVVFYYVFIKIFISIS
jgi:hypothetical protein